MDKKIELKNIYDVLFIIIYTTHITYNFMNTIASEINDLHNKLATLEHQQKIISENKRCQEIGTTEYLTKLYNETEEYKKNNTRDLKYCNIKMTYKIIRLTEKYFESIIANLHNINTRLDIIEKKKI